MNENQKMKFGVVGYGGQGSWHCNQILKSDVAQLSGTYDIDPKKLEKAKNNSIFTYPSFEALIADENVDTVVIAVPNDSHLELTLAALEAGKNAICEKPVEMSTEAFDVMCKAAKKSGKLFSVHQNRRWDVDFLAIKNIIESGEIGEVISIESRVHGSRGIPSDWRCTKAQGGGMILDWGVHLIDQMLQLIPSTITGVFCTTSHITNTDVDDGFKLELFFEDGKSAHVEVGTYNFLPLPRFYMQCKNGTAIITDWRENARVAKMKAWNEKEVIPVQTASGITKTMAPRDSITLDVYEAPRPASDVHDYYRNFTRAAAGIEQSLIKLSEVRRVLRVMEAAFESADKKQYISVDI